MDFGERTVYQIRARLVAAKGEEDGDIHLVVAQPGHPGRTMDCRDAVQRLHPRRPVATADEPRQ